MCGKIVGAFSASTTSGTATPLGLLLSRADQYRVELTATCVTPPRAPTASAPTAGLSCASLGQRFPHSQGDGFCQPAPTVSERHTFGIREQMVSGSRSQGAHER